ncbi:MAG TPA: hypothetical protein VL461_02410 [Dictyobacter sp.]|nr:hypothetical protein [Dictyobacter sp.]
MPQNTWQHKKLRMMVRSLIVLLLFGIGSDWLLFPHQAIATTNQSKQTEPVIQNITAGIGGSYQNGNWVPIHVTLSNNGTAFHGKLTLFSPPTGLTQRSGAQAISKYQENIDLPSLSQKQITLYLPLNNSTRLTPTLVTAQLLEPSGTVITSKNTQLTNPNPNAIIVGVLSNQPNNFSTLNSALSGAFKTTTIQDEALDATNFPQQAATLNNIDVIIIDNFTTSDLSQNQLAALRTWVYQGGTLIIAGGPEWHNTMNTLPGDLLPVTVQGTTTLPADTPIIPISTNNSTGATTLSTSLIISTAQTHAGSITLLAHNNTPLVAQSNVGQGNVSYLAYDPTLDPLVNWNGTARLWANLLLRPLADQMITNNTLGIAYQNMNQNTTAGPNQLGDLLQTFFPSSFPPLWIMLILLISYVLVLGPIRLLLVRYLKRRDWSWRIVLATILIFTLLSYGIAIQQKGTSVVSSSISLVQLDRSITPATTGHVTTYIGVFVPNQGNFNVHIPGNGLVQTVTNSGDINSISSQQIPNQPYTTTVETTPDGTDVHLQGVNIWTNRTIETQYDMPLQGKLTSTLTLQGNTVTGTVTNTLPYTLTDAYVLVGNDYLAISDLHPQETKTVSIPLSTSLTSPSTNGSTNTKPPVAIADRIAHAQGLPTGPYSTYIDPGQATQNEARKHAAVLEALSDSYCSDTNVVMCGNGTGIKNITGSTFIPTGTSAAIEGHDPLVIPGAAATLIGWLQTPLTPNSNVTVNGQIPAGMQETLLQAPLDVQMKGRVTIPNSFITSQIVDLQQNQDSNIQEPLTGSYSILNGAMTFEYTLPTPHTMQHPTLSFSDTVSAQQITNQGNATSSDINHLQVYLYNWQTDKWDTYTFTRSALTIPNASAYVNAQGRVLLHVRNQDSGAGAALFDKPEISIQGTVNNAT